MILFSLNYLHITDPNNCYAWDTGCTVWDLTLLNVLKVLLSVTRYTSVYKVFRWFFVGFLLFKVVVRILQLEPSISTLWYCAVYYSITHLLIHFFCGLSCVNRRLPRIFSTDDPSVLLFSNPSEIIPPKKPEIRVHWSRLLTLGYGQRYLILLGCLVLVIRLPFSMSIPHFVSETVGGLWEGDRGRVGTAIWSLIIAGVYCFFFAAGNFFEDIPLVISYFTVVQDILKNINSAYAISSRQTLDRKKINIAGEILINLNNKIPKTLKNYFFGI